VGDFPALVAQHSLNCGDTYRRYTDASSMIRPVSGASSPGRARNLPSRLPHDRLVQFCVSEQPLQTCKLLLEGLEARGLAHLHSAVLLSAPKVAANVLPRASSKSA
jgi:hypothetical protein